ncbi:hypothetical protein [Kitasatospora sp. NPDC088346]|uniref:hypothetical protein n=1 Tax=Kitasatospora sp. NPDC088346 TaxID=3364073 RepID=UPI0037F9D140
MTDQQQPPAACPQCGTAGGQLTARQAYEDRDGTLGGPPPGEVAPPPPPVAERATAGTALLVIGGLFAVKGGYDLLGPDQGLERFDAAYRAGARAGSLVVAAVLIALGLFRRWRAAGRAAVGPGERARWERRTAVWERARLCRTCRTAFWPAGALGEGFAASPPVPLERFPLTVAGLADQSFDAPSAPLTSSANHR